MRYLVKADGLNLRSAPKAVSPVNIITVLHRFHPVTKISEREGGWWVIETQVQGTFIRGYVASRYLESDLGSKDNGVQGRIETIHMKEKKGKLDAVHSRAFPLSEPDPIVRREISNDVKLKYLLEITDRLNVEQYLRYRPGGGRTFCNIYAYVLELEISEIYQFSKTNY